MNRKILFFLIPVLFFISACAEKPQETEETAPIQTIEDEIIKYGDMEYHKSFFPNGQIKTEGNMHNGKKEGKWMSWYENGIPWSETWFENGIKHGTTVSWYPSGKKMYEGEYTNGENSGIWKYWDKEGNLVKEELH
jgi:antitoxin component YwqK of YwqJK toxin-antitoxin module